MRGALAVSLLAMLLASSAVASRSSTGLHGFVLRGPIKPVCRTDEPCKGPAAGARVTFTSDGGAVFSTLTRATGFYRITVPPGAYAVRVRGTRTGRGIPTPRRVRVRAGADGRVDFFVDTGIQ